MTGKELSEKGSKTKSTAIMNALLIGFMIGIIIYSIVENSLGFFTLIPLLFIFKMLNNNTKKVGS